MPLFLVATPIGHLKDISERALECLRSCEAIYCEDTRTSSVLLHHYEISRPLFSFHKFNESSREEELLERLERGETLALISDAGSPALCDPGQRLVAACRAKGIEVTPVPGACSLIVALTASGLPTEPFQFLGFSPKLKSARKTAFEQCLQYPGTSLFFESPHRVVSSIELLLELAPGRQIALAKELTKKFETFFLGTPSEILSKLTPENVRGEWIVMIAPPLEPIKAIDPDIKLALEKVKELQAQGLSRRDSIIAVTTLTSCNSQALYLALN